MLPVPVSSPNNNAVRISRSVGGLAFSERRRHLRFRIILRADYILDGIRETAATCNVSSGGVFLTTDKLLRLGAPIRVLIDWPVLLDQRSPLQLEIIGTVARSDETGTAVLLKRHEFRLRSLSRTPAVGTRIS